MAKRGMALSRKPNWKQPKQNDMETTLKLKISAVCDGYDWIGIRELSKDRKWWVDVTNAVNHSWAMRIEADTYEELRDSVYKRIGMMLPPRQDLRLKNYGAPYNVAEV